MRPIDRNEVLGIGEYETIRERFRSRIIEEKRPRRVRIGDHLTAVFENRDSVLFQIQEMLRTERITSESGVLHEIETYNELVPGEGQLSLTLFVEIPERSLRDKMLVELAGLEDTVSLEVDGVAARAVGKREGAVEGRTTAVHYLKVDLPEAAQAALKARRAAASIVVAHPHYSVKAPLGKATLDKLAEDLA
ncbi:hypothetical protein SOCE26_022610 [Sorangium cellulosum]|uniref:DUF3501 family protein n=1 Tax=Sorangium cellulosum TaxID=56 RepID=A0A2L0ENI7_SORCE|nr:DUF3501 family protein [Sorangium cellulosum]AUX40859.1 hypothetical protein SOCE26_022610 [Sorangium cellulosum]